MDTVFKALAITCMVIGLLFVGSCAFLGLTVANDPDVQESVKELDALSEEMNQPPVITLAEFEAIKQGMTYQQVVQVVGTEGTLSSESGFDNFDGTKTMFKTYSWNNADISSASIGFTDGKVDNKFQVGLK